jgi:hypothetical protein
VCAICEPNKAEKSGTQRAHRKKQPLKINDLQGFRVPRTGFEPAHLTALLPESSASTNFATWASPIAFGGANIRKKTASSKKDHNYVITLAGNYVITPAGLAAFQPMSSTPTITSTVPITCSKKIGSPSTQWA